MLSEPRSISLVCELVHIPMKHTADHLRELYNRVCRSCGYENFIRTSSGARIEKQEAEGEGFSHLNLAGDRIQFTDDHVGISVDQFARKVSAVLREAFPLLRIPVVLVQQATVRVITTPNSFKTAAEYLARSLFRIRTADLELLGRPTSVFGFRLVFPPTREQSHGFNTRIESYLRDGRSLYVETVGTFKIPIQPQSLQMVEENILATAQFSSEKVIPFLSRYDRREDED
ncbi:MAG: hypothetical protein JXA90_13095 [Planctomycetes bacterium]|nr:hypothetical protein [Planctomycetota bacterium]